MILVKIYLGLSLVLLWTVWGPFIFRQFLGPAYISQDLQAPSCVVGTNDRVLIYCICHFQGGSLCFSFFCLLVFSVSNFHHDTRGRWWTLFGLTCSVLENSEREGNTRSSDLPLEKPICRSGSNSQNWTWNKRLVPNRKRSTSRLYYCHPAY